MDRMAAGRKTGVRRTAERKTEGRKTAAVTTEARADAYRDRMPVSRIRQAEEAQAMADIRKMDFLPYSAFSVCGIDSEAFAIYRIGRGKAAVGIINRCPRDRHVSIDVFMLPKNSCTVLYGNAFPEISETGISVHLRAKESAVLLFADTTLPERRGTIA